LQKSGWAIEHVFKKFGDGLMGVVIQQALEDTTGEEQHGGKDAKRGKERERRSRT
jgi:hypothetical protein